MEEYAEVQAEHQDKKKLLDEILIFLLTDPNFPPPNDIVSYIPPWLLRALVSPILSILKNDHSVDHTFFQCCPIGELTAPIFQIFIPADLDYNSMSHAQEKMFLHGLHERVHILLQLI
jgi:hypothetical protein